MNAGSSRSHLIFAIRCVKTDKTDGKKYFGKLSLVDLAGSESVGKTGADKQRYAELIGCTLRERERVRVRVRKRETAFFTLGLAGIQ